MCRPTEGALFCNIGRHSIRGDAFGGLTSAVIENAVQDAIEVGPSVDAVVTPG
ncbi:hypothetical protein VB734_09610 [Synechococcus sp. BA-124 BA4]|uniref:hypothetical protein n=1 Tax=unclassified Synechococcus TaxID=2626047 RepID=UPI0018CF7C8B|nr:MULTISPECIES: hypothetical protein [unclassified Synechococcus]MEA5400295.1 hypothetical protein [Synechococcus sp. BA-124 BA4]QPN56984.1 hypothetical protein I1E95_02050 [Synechococcus sp. CBW1107]